MQHTITFGSVVRPVQNGKPFTNQSEIIQMQKDGRLPYDQANIAHLSHPTEGFYIVTSPELDQMPTDASIFEFLSSKAIDVEV